MAIFAFVQYSRNKWGTTRLSDNDLPWFNIINIITVNTFWASLACDNFFCLLFFPPAGFALSWLDSTDASRLPSGVSRDPLDPCDDSLETFEKSLPRLLLFDHFPGTSCGYEVKVVFIHITTYFFGYFFFYWKLFPINSYLKISLE